MPYKPNPLKYSYLLQNSYGTVSNLVRRPTPPTPTPDTADAANQDAPADNTTTPEPTTADAEAVGSREASPAPTFGGGEAPDTASKREAANASNMSSRPQPSGAQIATEALKGLKATARPTQLERVQNMGMFGRGGGGFDAKGNMKQSPLMFD